MNWIEWIAICFEDVINELNCGDVGNRITKWVSFMNFEKTIELNSWHPWRYSTLRNAVLGIAGVIETGCTAGAHDRIDYWRDLLDWPESEKNIITQICGGVILWWKHICLEKGDVEIVRQYYWDYFCTKKNTKNVYCSFFNGNEYGTLFNGTIFL